MRQELESVFDQDDESDNMEPNEKEIITNIFEYSKLTVHEAMTARAEISCISSDATFKAFLAISSAFISVSINTFAAARA